MKQFINLETGIIEIPHNKDVIEQYEKHTEIYAEYKSQDKVVTNNSKKRK